MYVNILNYQQRRFLWWSLALLAISLLIYVSQPGSLPPNGGSWQGYLLGSIGLALIVWLSWFGIRKRDYHNPRGSLQGWASAHVYLGLSLLVVASLHCAFQFGINVHTLSYALMCVVIFSGFYGLYNYLRYPKLMVSNRANQSFDERLQELEELDANALSIARQCDPGVQTAINSAINRATLGGTLLDQLLERDRSLVELPKSGSANALTDNRGQQALRDYLATKIPNASKQGEAQRLQDLLSISGRRQEILRRLRREIGLQLRLKLWLSVHIPATIALLMALLIHVVTVFFYW
jgi:hypothetical protein